MTVKRSPPKALYGRAPQDLRVRVKATHASSLVPSDTYQGSAVERLTPLLRGTVPLYGRGTGLSSLEALDNESREGNERATYDALGRTSVTERRIPYGPRGLRVRTPRSSRGRHDPPRRTVTPSTGRRGIPRRRERASSTGGRRGSYDSQAGRYARCEMPQRLWGSSENAETASPGVM
jgi:hypothetical protein